VERGHRRPGAPLSAVPGLVRPADIEVGLHDTRLWPRRGLNWVGDFLSPHDIDVSGSPRRRLDLTVDLSNERR
jgi:hypothetical protein